MGEKLDLSRLKINREARGEAQNRRIAWGMWTVAVGLLGFSVIYFLSTKSAEQPIIPSVQLSSSAAAQTPTVTGSEPRVLNATGYVVAQRKASVASKATGQLAQLLVEEGDKVKKDQLLGTLANDDMKAAVREMEAQLSAYQARIEFAKAELEDSRQNRERVFRLRAKGVSTEEQVDQAEARFSKAQAELRSAEANKVLAEAQLDKAKVELSYTEIRAPFDGTVLTKNADVGEIVAPFGSSSTARAAIVTLADMDSLEVEADVSESNLSKVYLGQKCKISLDSVPGRVYLGEVKNIVPTVDRAKATVLTKIKFLDKDDRVIPEMSAKVAFEIR